MSVDEIAPAGNRRQAAMCALASPAQDISAWWCELAWNADELAAGVTLLSAAELARADRYGTSALRNRYVAGRASLRRLLGELLHVSPAEVPLARGARGRPHIDLPGAPDFNVSNTRDCALIAVCGDTRMRVGVDIEHRERAAAALKLARKFLADDEQRALARYPEPLQREYFLRWWTCKEAMSKATGDGLSAPFSRLHVSIEPDLALLQGPLPYTASDWRLCAVAVPAGFLGTLAQWTPAIAPVPGPA